MKTYTVYFTEPVTYTYKGDKWNKETHKWECGVDCEKVNNVFTFCSLTAAKRLIKANIDKYESSCITKIWSNGYLENCGEINLKGSNKTFIANTRQKVANY